VTSPLKAAVAAVTQPAMLWTSVEELPAGVLSYLFAVVVILLEEVFVEVEGVAEWQIVEALQDVAAGYYYGQYFAEHPGSAGSH